MYDILSLQQLQFHPFQTLVSRNLPEYVNLRFRENIIETVVKNKAKYRIDMEEALMIHGHKKNLSMS